MPLGGRAALVLDQRGDETLAEVIGRPGPPVARPAGALGQPTCWSAGRAGPRRHPPRHQAGQSRRLEGAQRPGQAPGALRLLAGPGRRRDRHCRAPRRTWTRSWTPAAAAVTTPRPSATPPPWCSSRWPPATPRLRRRPSDPAVLARSPTVEPVMFDPALAAPLTAFFSNALHPRSGAPARHRRGHAARTGRQSSRRYRADAPHHDPTPDGRRRHRASPPAFQPGRCPRSPRTAVLATVGDLLAVDPSG